MGSIPKKLPRRPSKKLSRKPLKKPAPKAWTFMVYMAGDNNLAVDMAYALEQIKSVAEVGTESPNLFVYYDGNSPAIPTLYCDFSEPGKPRYVRSFKVPDKLIPVTVNDGLHGIFQVDSRDIRISEDVNRYRAYIQRSRGEFTLDD